jgi:hypothetical protein
MQHRLTGTLSVSAQKICDGVVKLTIEATNTTPLPPDSKDRRSVLLHSLLSAHMIVAVYGGAFASLLDPPKYLQEAAQACQKYRQFPGIGRVGRRAGHVALLAYSSLRLSSGRSGERR